MATSTRDAARSRRRAHGAGAAGLGAGALALAAARRQKLTRRGALRGLLGAGALVALPAGLSLGGLAQLSGGAELLDAMTGRTAVLPFTVERVIAHEKAVWSHNPVLFEFESIEALSSELRRYFDPIREGRS